MSKQKAAKLARRIARRLSAAEGLPTHAHGRTPPDSQSRQQSMTITLQPSTRAVYKALKGLKDKPKNPGMTDKVTNPGMKDTVTHPGMTNETPPPSEPNPTVYLGGVTFDIVNSPQSFKRAMQDRV